MTYQEHQATKHFGDNVSVIDDRVMQEFTPTHQDSGPSYFVKVGYFCDDGDLIDSTGDIDRRV